MTETFDSIDIQNIEDFIPTTSSVPSYVPKSFYDQFRIYKDGTTRRFYWYDTENNEWVYVSGSV